MTNRTDLLQQLNRLRREERALKVEELKIRSVTPAKDQREPLARNHEKRMKNKRQISLVTTELRTEATPAAPVSDPTITPGVDPTIAPVTDNEPPTLPPSPSPPPGDSIER